MKGYKIYNQDRMGYERNIKYTTNYDKAIRAFNDMVREELKQVGGDLIVKEDFGEEIYKLKTSIYIKEKEIISRSYPYLLYKQNGMMIANIFYWEKTSYEYDEYDIVNSTVILEEIEIIE